MATNKALDQLSDLRAEIRSLGATLGRTIAALEQWLNAIHAARANRRA